MPNAVVITGYGPPEVLKWTGVPLWEPGEGQIRITVKGAGISPTDLALRAGYLKAIPLPPSTVLGFEAAGTVDAVGPGVTGTSASRHPPRSGTSSERSTTSTTIVCAQPPCRANPSGRVSRKPGAIQANGRLRLRACKSMPMQQAAEAHHQLESGNIHERIILTLE